MDFYYTYLSAINILHCRFSEQEIHKVASLKASNKLWIIKPIIVVLFGANNLIVIGLKEILKNKIIIDVLSQLQRPNLPHSV